LNIELPITIRFGLKKMLLQDVVQVNAGATIEFDRRVNDPVEILVNGRAVARGEAVVVRGNYGIRIIEIADRNDWLETSAIVERGSGSRKAE
jgi:flagellar motor switch protein FliN/FliY